MGLRGPRPATGYAEWLLFWRKVAVGDGCWEWQGALSAGYGSYRRQTETRLAHRRAYEDLVGPIPEDLQLDHLCRNPRCVNPSHLEPVTSRENTVRGTNPNMVRHLAATCPKGHNKAEHRYVSPKGVGYCRICRADYRRRCLRDSQGAFG